MHPLRAATLLPCLALAACQTPQQPPLTPTQREALESRHFDLPRDPVARAVATALLDAGYIIRSSDFEAGLVCGERRTPSAPSGAYARSGGLGSSPYVVDLAVAWVHADGPGSAARLHLEAAGGANLNPDEYARFWRQVDARLLPKEVAR